MVLNEGIVTSDTKIKMKSEMLRQLAVLEQATPDEWERAVFESLTGQKREDVDWDVEDNHAGYYTWIRSFDQLSNLNGPVQTGLRPISLPSLPTAVGLTMSIWLR